MDFQSSPSSSERTWKYDVFLSFAEEDTSEFVHNLSIALEGAGLMRLRESFRPLLLKEIEETQIYIVVFSKNYAASTYRLAELSKIAECIKPNVPPQHSVLPVFYDVDPFEVRNKERNYFAEYFAKHEKNFKLQGRKERDYIAVQDLDDVRRWRPATTLVAKRRGWFGQHKIMPHVIDEIVKTAMEILRHKSSSSSAIVRIRSNQIEKVEKLLDLGSVNIVRFVGIWGMVGIGKTTLATAVYDRISHHFDASCFLPNVSRHELSYLEAELLRQTLQQRYVQNLQTWDSARSILRFHRILVVLDDVDELEKLEALVGNPDWFGAGSRIIITTRDKNILKMHGIDRIHDVELLSKEEALQLLCRSAFRCDYPSEGYEEMTYSALEYVNGIPFAIKSLGLSLLYRSVTEWRDVLAKLSKNLDNSILKVLEKGFNELRWLEKEIFLDIACFFVGEEINYVKEILASVHYNSNIGYQIGVLMDKSALTISDQRIQMHYMLQKFGQEHVKKEKASQELEWQDRIWLYDNFRQLMETDAETVYTGGIVLLNQEDSEGTPLRVDGLSKMIYLRLLILRNVNFFGSLNYLSSELQYLSWHKYPVTCLPSDFMPRGLTHMIMPESCMTRLWEGIKMLPVLRSLDLSGSKCLVESPIFEGLPSLERLDLEGCTKLLQLHPSIAYLGTLKFINLRNCKSLVSIPNKLFELSSLQILNLAGCSKLAECVSSKYPLKKQIKEKLLNKFI